MKKTKHELRDAEVGERLAKHFLDGLGPSDPCPEGELDWDAAMDDLAASGVQFDRQRAYEHGFEILRRRTRRLRVEAMVRRLGEAARGQPLERNESGTTLLTALNVRFVTPAFVPEWVMPDWFAWASFWLGRADVMSDAAWPGVVARYVRLAEHWQYFNDMPRFTWRRAQALWTLECLSLYEEATREYYGGHPNEAVDNDIAIARGLWERVENGYEPADVEIEQIIASYDWVPPPAIGALRRPAEIFDFVSSIVCMTGRGMEAFRNPQRRDRAALALLDVMERMIPTGVCSNG